MHRPVIYSMAKLMWYYWNCIDYQHEWFIWYMYVKWEIEKPECLFYSIMPYLVFIQMTFQNYFCYFITYVVFFIRYLHTPKCKWYWSNGTYVTFPKFFENFHKTLLFHLGTLGKTISEFFTWKQQNCFQMFFISSSNSKNFIYVPLWKII